MNEAQLARFERAVERFVQAAEAMQREPADKVRTAVETDRAEEWKRDLKAIREGVEDLVAAAEDDE